MNHLLLGLIVLPLLGAALILLTSDDSQFGLRNIRFTALFATVLTFALSLLAWKEFNPATADFQLVDEAAW